MLFTPRSVPSGFLFLLFAGGILPFAASVSAAEPQWIWSQKDAPNKAAAETLSFRKAVSLEQPEAGSASPKARV